LENAIEHAIVLGSTDEIVPEDLPEAVLEAEPSRHDPIAKYHEGVFEAKKQLIVNAIEQANGNLAEAARRLGLNPTYLHRLIRNMNL
jgi:two-component system response regulator HydG